MKPVPHILRKSSDQEPGISRVRRGKGFSYHDPSGKTIQDPVQKARITGLGLPPAYDDVWICLDDFGHLQATGRDARGRKQYRYHVDWSEFRARQKYNNLVGFGEALPSLRRKVAKDLRQESPTKSMVSAALVRLLDRTALRVGNAYYAQENGSYGATTLRRKHVKFSEDRILFDYKAKGGKRVRTTTTDKTLHKTLEKIDELPGHALFQYIDDKGQRHSLDSSDVNDYIGEGQSAKIFRTWRGSVTAFHTACSEEDPTIKSLSEAAAEVLHNTPTICRNSYIHPAIIDFSKEDWSNRQRIQKGFASIHTRGLRRAEIDMLEFLKRSTL